MRKQKNIHNILIYLNKFELTRKLRWIVMYQRQNKQQVGSYFTFDNLHKCEHYSRVTLSKVYHYAQDNTMHDVHWWNSAIGHTYILSHSELEHTMKLLRICFWWHSAFDHILHLVTLCIWSSSAQVQSLNIYKGLHKAPVCHFRHNNNNFWEEQNTEKGHTLHRFLLCIGSHSA